jgi:hypothetical protein
MINAFFNLSVSVDVVIKLELMGNILILERQLERLTH